MRGVWAHGCAVTVQCRFLSTWIDQRRRDLGGERTSRAKRGFLPSRRRWVRWGRGLLWTEPEPAASAVGGGAAATMFGSIVQRHQLIKASWRVRVGERAGSCRAWHSLAMTSQEPGAGLPRRHHGPGPSWAPQGGTEVCLPGFAALPECAPASCLLWLVSPAEGGPGSSSVASFYLAPS